MCKVIADGLSHLSLKLQAQLPAGRAWPAQQTRGSGKSWARQQEGSVPLPMHMPKHPHGSAGARSSQEPHCPGDIRGGTNKETHMPARIHMHIYTHFPRWEEPGRLRGECGSRAGLERTSGHFAMLS